jgi:hypothetical protein
LRRDGAQRLDGPVRAASRPAPPPRRPRQAMTEIRNVEAELMRFRIRLAVVGLAVLLAFGLLGWRLYHLQVLRHDELARQAESNRTAVMPVVPHRGEITDRNGVVLATNYKAYTLEITPSRTGRGIDDTIDAIAQVIEVTPRDRRRFKRMREDSRSFESLPIRMHLTDEEVARFAAQRWRFPGAEIKARLFRNYPLGETGAHVIGYIGRINQKEKERIEDSDDAANYRGTDYIGKLGVEASYEKTLHGGTGWEQMETSAGGRAVRRLGSHPATPGDAVRLSTPTCSSTASTTRAGTSSTTPSTSRCSTARCAAPIRRAPPTSPSWAWPRWKPASARPAASPWTAAPGPSAATPSARATRWGRWTCTAASSSPATCTTTSWPTTWGSTPSTTS